MAELKTIEYKDEYCISFDEDNELIRYHYCPNSSHMYFRWWNVDSVLKLLTRRLERGTYCVVKADRTLKTIPTHNNLYRDTVICFIHYAYPKILEYLESNGYKKLRKKDFNRKMLEKCNINYLTHLYNKIK